MTKDLTSQFSRNIVLVSLIFFLASLGVYGLKYLGGQPEALRPVAPKLISATIEDIEVRSAYDETYRSAQKDEEVFSGTYIKTGQAEFAELVLESNAVRLDEQTEIRLVKNNYFENGPFIPDKPRLEIELLAGSIWVNALDSIEVRTPRSIVDLQHNVGILTYSAPINRLMVVTGSVRLRLLGENGGTLSDFSVPLHNQVTFVDQQITDTYAALKPSKLKKELKMMPISDEVLADEWVRRNANDFEKERTEFNDSLITSGLVYRIRSGCQKALRYLTFIPEARRNLDIARAKTMLAYLLGAVQNSGDLAEAAKVIEKFEALANMRRNDPQINNLIVNTLYSIEYSRIGTPAYLLKEDLINHVLGKEGPHVLDIYLTDLRRTLYEQDIQTSETVAAKWLNAWKMTLTEANIGEFDRQSGILNHTILSYIDFITSPVLDVFDESGIMKMAYAEDIEEARFEVTSDRLQIAASLISSYRYLLAKQYLKSSYVSLGIESLSPDLSSTQIFLENGRLLAQRIEYAENVLHGAAESIDETKFRDYFQTVRRDEALSGDLRKFFELDQKELTMKSKVEAPTAAQVAERFLDARINVNYADISLKPSGGFYFKVENARLIDRGAKNELLSFDATYDFVSNSVTDVITGGKTYRGSFRLNDIVMALKKGAELESLVPVPKLEEGIELLITDREKIEAQEGQAIAQDVARQLAYNQLNAYGIVIPEAKSDIVILDALNLNRFEIKNALIVRPDQKEAIKVSFEYYAGTKEATKVTGAEGLILLDRVPISQLAEKVVEAEFRLEKELKTVGDFTYFAGQNELEIAPENISYTDKGLLSMKDLELLTLGLKVSALYDPETEKFVSVSHPLFSGQDTGVKDYFEQLADQWVISLMRENGYEVATGQIETAYPFNKIIIHELALDDDLISFTLDISGNKALEITGTGIADMISEMSLKDLDSLSVK
ncbi:hypothetical protein KJ657_00610 [Patescibacteria group bacterium]|nr:hypothetical protein [Patescibacteria group bacterium]MBU1015578.1 hypothetical protein [Patescibacteria group bacterium]MBU1684730.1 hypothetical protein [Patescibacteria group bacterium]MBU1938281.1 hypothetical protein [Patescibacteria group bacterium]